MTKLVKNKDTGAEIEILYNVLDYSKRSVTLKSGKGTTVLNYPFDIEVTDLEETKNG